MYQQHHIKIMTTMYKVAKTGPQITFMNNFFKMCNTPPKFPGTSDLPRRS